MDNSYEWGLMSCSDCPDESKDMEWDCWKQAGCDIDDDSGICKTGTDLHDAGIVFWSFSMLTIFCLVFVAQKTLYVIIGTEFGDKRPVYIFMVAACVF